tara:strand:- start:395 stop:1279 length:885 start_codon:yes stop_codon:yes gene_type:complete
MTAQLFAIIAPVFIIAGFGFGWRRLHLPFDTATVTAIATNLGTPALILATLSKLEVSAEAFTEMLLATALTLVGFAILGGLTLKLARLPLRAFLTPVMMANAGNMGLPLCLFAFGQEGLSLAIAVFAVIAGYHFSVGIAVVSGRFSLGKFARTPVIYATVLGLGLVATGTELPGWMDNTLKLLGGIAIPMMLLALGVSLSGLRLASLGQAGIVAAIRLVVGLAVGLGVARLLGLSDTATGVLIIQSAMPVAVFNYLFASIYAQRPEAVAGSVLLSTAVSFLTLPFLLLLALGQL